MNWQGKNVLVVGGTSGIGAAVVDQLLSNGCNVYNISRRVVQIEGVHHITLDITKDFKSIEGLPEELHGLVYCPGSITLKPIQSLQVSDFSNEFELNVLGAVKVIKSCLKSLKQAGSASVVLFSTVAVSQGMMYHASIASAKGAVEGLTRSLAAEMARFNIRFNAVAPSLTDTPLASGLLSNEEKRKSSDERHPLRRIGKPEDISASVTYLLSEESSWMTGQIIHIDGGMSSIRPI